MANRCMPAVRGMFVRMVGMLFLGTGGHRVHSFLASGGAVA
jgi:hypothetical protein